MDNSRLNYENIVIAMLPGAADYLKQTWIPWQKLGPANTTPGKLKS